VYGQTYAMYIVRLVLSMSRHTRLVFVVKLT